MPSEGKLSRRWIFQISQRLHFQLTDKWSGWPEVGAMRCRHAAQTKHLRIAEPFQDLPKIFPDGNNAVVREGKLHPFHGIIVHMADGIQP